MTGQHMPVRILTPAQHDRHLAAVELADALVERRRRRQHLKAARRLGRLAAFTAADQAYADAGRRLNAALQHWYELNQQPKGDTE